MDQNQQHSQGSENQGKTPDHQNVDRTEHEIANQSLGSDVHIEYGASEMDLPLVDYQVGDVRNAVQTTMNVDPQAKAYVNGQEVEGDYVLKAGDRLEFMRQSGSKGSQEVRRAELASEVEQQQNSVTIFSNGTAHHRRVVGVKGFEKVQIPVNRNHVADVLSSLVVTNSAVSSGAVRIANPATYTPHSQPVVQLDRKAVMVDMARKFCGSGVIISQANNEIKGVLCGTDTREARGVSSVLIEDVVVVLTDDGLRQARVADIVSMKFNDKAIQSEIEKSLRDAFNNIKPESSFISLSLASEGDEAIALVDYIVPASAWKMSYRLIRKDDGSEDGSCIFQGYAIVDNNTDEDWQDVIVSVVAGEPMTFSTDLAECKIPNRQHVNIVSEAVVGGEEVTRGIRRRRRLDAGSSSSSRSFASSGEAVFEAMSIGSDECCSGEIAEMSQAEIDEVGDFSIFKTGETITINSNTSALVPMFSVPLDECKTVLHYQGGTQANRCVAFTNSTKHSLSRGTCNIYEQGINAGLSVLPALKPGGFALVPHAVETGVRFKMEPGERTAVGYKGFRITDTVAYSQVMHKTQTVLYADNSTDEDFTLYYDYVHQLGPHPHASHASDLVLKIEVDGTVIDNNEVGGVTCQEVLLDGNLIVQVSRLATQIPANSVAAITIVENGLVESSMQVVGEFQRFLNQCQNWPAQSFEIDKCVELSRSIEQKRKERQDLVDEVAKLGTRLVRLRENMKSLSENFNTEKFAEVTKMQQELVEANNRITEIEDQLAPNLEEEIRRLKGELDEAIKAINIDLSFDEPRPMA